MKCLILAGGKGERLWPLSRRNYPKQFISVQGNHSVFQETVARNIPFCDEFIIVTSSEYSNIVTNQLTAFQGLSYRVILEGAARRTLASVCLACMDLVLSEFVFVVSSDLLIEPSDEYKEAILQAKKYAAEGYICAFAREEEKFDKRYGYLSDLMPDGRCGGFVEKPQVMPEGRLFRNLGMALFKAGDLMNEVSILHPQYYDILKKVHSQGKADGVSTLYEACDMNLLDAFSIERAVMSKTSLLRGVLCDFKWNELTGFKDLEYTSFRNEGLVCMDSSPGTIAINNSSSAALVVSGIEDAVVVSTEDAVYVGKKDSDIKKVIEKSDLIEPFLDRGIRAYRQWGYFDTLAEGHGYHIRKVTVTPGKTIYAHRHENREENWTLLSGEAAVTLDGVMQKVTGRKNFNIPAKVLHQISNIGDKDVIFIDTTFGDSDNMEECLPRQTEDIDEITLGIDSEPMVKMKPVFMDYLWGGRRLVDLFGYKCDYPHVAEAWVMSAHPSGQSVITTGRHKGSKFGTYIKTVGKDILGWKCSHLISFPLLVKFIDAENDLSIQVHPDDEYAMEKEGEYGKNEMWYIMDSDEGAGLYIGFRRDVTPQEVRSSIEDGTLTDLLNFVPTKKGDVFFIPAGTVHAIGKGNLVCEVQQSSSCTYRLFDFGRKDQYGNLRELHVDKALDVMNLKRYDVDGTEADGNLLCRCKYFEVYRYDVRDTRLSLAGDDSVFRMAVCLEGRGVIRVGEHELSLKAGEGTFIGASGDSIVLTGDMSVLVCHV